MDDIIKALIRAKKQSLPPLDSEWLKESEEELNEEVTSED